MKPIFDLITEHKFWSLIAAALVASGVAWAGDFQQWIPVIVLVAGAAAGAWKVYERKQAGKAEPVQPPAPEPEIGVMDGAEVVEE